MCVVIHCLDVIIRNVDVEIPFGIDSKEWSRTFTYVDTTGRPTLIIRKKNVVDEHNVPFQVMLIHLFFHFA